MIKPAGFWFGIMLGSGLWISGIPDPTHPLMGRTLAVTALVATWWMTQAVPLGLSSIMPLALLPAMGVLPFGQVLALYATPTVFLFIGGFLVAGAMERWGLHRRLALAILERGVLRRMGPLLAVMVVTFFLSMWMSNTATALMMTPLAIALAGDPAGDQRKSLAPALLMGVSYAASIGGMASLVGTAPNLSFQRIYVLNFPEAASIDILGWLALCTPPSVLMLMAAWALLQGTNRGGLSKAGMNHEPSGAIPMTLEQKVVLGIFAAMVFLWLGKGWMGLDVLDDAVVALAAALALFLWRRPGGGGVLDPGAVKRLPWDLVLLFGGGFAISSAFKESGLSKALGTDLARWVDGAPYPMMILGVIVSLTFISELVSNTSTAELTLPVLAGLATALELDPLALMLPATLACSMGFMLPVATPPNTIIYGTGRVPLNQMLRCGVIMNLVGAIILTLYFWGLKEWGIDL
ncbi:MAG: DASS family sodium-coupled anion symporter [Planctomycetota bacterium]